MKRLGRCGCCCLLPTLLAAGLGILWFTHQLQPPSEVQRPTKVVIPLGSTPKQIARQLRRQGLIRNELAFFWVARDRLKSLKSGGYELSPDMTVAQIVERLTRGGQDVSEVSVTIPEGFTLRQIAKTLETRGVIRDEEAFARAASSGMDDLDAPFEVKAKSLEGYLYPETYRFPPAAESERAAETMLQTFDREFRRPYREEIRKAGHSLHDLVTIASLVEREARVPQDRARISGVIHNRIRKGMRLEIDATVLYALGRHKNRVLYRDLNVESPYNTYRRKGLPPGPIANPGKEALLAALRPEKHDFLFYVAKPDGSHAFSRTMAEHNRRVAHFRALRRANR